MLSISSIVLLDRHIPFTNSTSVMTSLEIASIISSVSTYLKESGLLSDSSLIFKTEPDRVQEAFPFKLVWFLKPEFFHLSFVLNAWWIWLTPGTLFTFSSASIKGCTRSRESKWYFLQTCRQHKFSILRTIKLNFLPFDDFSIEESGLIRLLKWWPLCKLGTQFRSRVDSLH